jgi:hypothetical protein
MIYIEARTLAVVKDDGAEAFGDMEWHDASYAECPECRYHGTVKEFTVGYALEADQDGAIATTASQHTPGPWAYDMDFIVAPDPSGRHPDIYIAEIADSDEEGRIASLEQQDANRKLIAAAPRLLDACRMVVERWETGDLAEAARTCSAAIAEAA